MSEQETETEVDKYVSKRLGVPTLHDRIDGLEQEAKRHHAAIEEWQEGLQADMTKWAADTSADIKGFIERQEAAVVDVAQTHIDHGERIKLIEKRLADRTKLHKTWRARLDNVQDGARRRAPLGQLPRRPPTQGRLRPLSGARRHRSGPERASDRVVGG